METNKPVAEEEEVPVDVPSTALLLFFNERSFAILSLYCSKISSGG